MNNNESKINELIELDANLDNKEYLGTFRWKKGLTLTKLNSNLIYDYDSLTEWKDYISKRIDFEVFPYIIDALSYPLSIIYALENIRKTNSMFALQDESIINLVIMGVSQKAEGRIALESNYFEEIYHYFNQKNKNLKELNLYFVGEELKLDYSFTSQTIDKIKFYFSPKIIGEFLKDNAFSFNKNNTIFFGLNCGFGAGYLKLTLNWIKDLTKLLKFGYLLAFTYTNDYEDKIGELTIMKIILNSNIMLEINDNPFKSMTVYKSEDGNLWSCGNYGIYIVKGCDKIKIDKFLKLDEFKMKQTIEEELNKNGIVIK